MLCVLGDNMSIKVFGMNFAKAKVLRAFEDNN